MLSPSCSCCGGQCGCVCGSLPYSLTVTFTGLKNKTHSVHCPLTFESDFGCGAAGVALEPGGCLDDEPECGTSNVGPLTSVLLTEPGHGYARIGRKEPVLSVSGGTGTGATFTPTLAAVDGTLDKQCRTYKIASIAVSGGNGYADNDPLTITTDGTTVTPAVAVVRTSTTRVQPTVTASVGGVTGESLSVTLASNGGSPETWGVSAVGVVTAGTGWSSNDWTLPVTFATSDTTVTAATATATRQVISPGAEYSYTSGGGTGFSATVTLTEQTCDDGHPCWLPASISITSGGTGYAVDDVIEFLAINRDIANGIEGVANYTVLSVDGSGGVLSVSGPDVPEPFRKFTGGIDSIKVDSAGAYYKLVDGGTPSSVDVTAPGEYYTEDPTAPACVADVTVKVDCAEGSGYPSPTAEATINATIDDDPTSATFGQITALDIASGGSGYLVWMWVCTNLSSLNNVPIVLKAEWTDRIWTLVDGIPTTYTDVLHPAKQLVSLEVGSCFGSGACIKIIPTGDDITCETEPTTRPGEYSGQPGPIQKIELIEGGSGYVVKGRVAPGWTVTANGYEFTPTFGESKTDDCGLEWWPVESLAFDPAEDKTKLDGWAINFTPTPPERSDEPFLAVVRTRQEPTVTATAKGPAIGADIEVTLAESDDGAAVAVAKLSGSISSIAVLDGGGGYSTAPVVIMDGNATATAAITGSVSAVILTDGGSGYTSSPSVSFSGGGGSGATAAAVVSAEGVISGVVLTDTGSNYTSAPVVAIAGGGGSGAKAAARIEGKVTSVSVTKAGSGYSAPPTVSLKGGGGQGASASAKISAVVSGITITDPGFGYTKAPTVSIVGGGGDGATATASVAGGVVTSIEIANKGDDYGSEPIIEISGGRVARDRYWRVASLSVASGGGVTTVAKATAGIEGVVADVIITCGGSKYDSAPTVSFSGGGGSGASAVADFSEGVVTGITLTSTGSKYTSAPTVSISGGGGSGATAIAEISATVTKITLDSGGAGYATIPTVAISGWGGLGAKAVAEVSGGAVSKITVTDGGRGYKKAPIVSFSGGGYTNSTGAPDGGAVSSVATASASIEGVVSGVLLTNGGDEYTSPPSVSFSGGGGSGAKAVAQILGSVKSISLGSGGSGYSWPPVVTIGDGNEASAIAAINAFGGVKSLELISPGGQVYSSSPPVSFSGGGGGYGATATTKISARVSAITVTDGGSGYKSSPDVSISGDGKNATAVATINAKVAKISLDSSGSGYETPPTVIFSGGGGTGAEAKAEVSGGVVSKITLTKQGSGYTSAPAIAVKGGGAAASGAISKFVDIKFSVPARTGEFGAYEIVPATAVGVVDSKGAITDAKILDPGKYFLDNGIPQSVDLIRGGRYYREDSSLTPTASAPVVTVSQIPPSNGSGAKVTVTVDNDVASPTFGEVVSASLDNKGSGYTLLGPPMDCEYRGQCDLYFGSPYVSFRTRGNGKPPEIALYGGTQIVLRAVDPLGDCDSLPSTATLLYGAPAGVEASISNGGTVQASCNPPNWCAPCFCPATLTGTGTHLEITSNYPCNDGFAEYSGAAGDVDFGCSWTDPGSDITYDSDVTVSFHCCPKNCQDDGECVYDMYVKISGVLGLPEESPGWFSNGELGRSQCIGVTITDGDVNATFSVPVAGYTFTIVLGDG